MKKSILILFLAMMTSWVRANHWNPNTGQFADYMTVTAVVQINGTEQQSTQLELGAFCGEEVRGSKYAQQAPNGRYIFRLACWGNAGDVFTFRLYDAVLDEELDYLTCEVTLDYATNGYGGAMSPYVLNFSGTNTSTYTLPIIGYGTSTGGYYLIAPPIDDVDPATVEGMTEGDYDLYYFDQGEDLEWRNYKANPFNLESGKGYLYAHKTDITLTFTGAPYSSNGQVTLNKTNGAQFAGVNLVGNPFPQTAYIGGRNFYVMNADGSEIIAAETAGINAMQGIFVIAEEDGEVLAFNTENTTVGKPRLVLNVHQGRSAAIDRVIVRFGDVSVLPKFMLNQDNTKLYISQDGTDYAVMTANSSNVTSVSFKAQQNGTYTLCSEMFNIDLNYLHLIDNQTGADIDLLQTPSYTFEARTTDYANRFRLVYTVNTGVEENIMPFAFVSDSDIFVTEVSDGAVLQILDMAGRIIVSRDGVHTVSTLDMVPGVYVLRLIEGNEVRTQKVVIQ